MTVTYGVATHDPPIFVFRVRPKGGAYLPRTTDEVWRDIAIAGDQTMEHLAEYILDAYDFDNDHLSSFYMSGKRWDTSSEIKVASGDQYETMDSMFAPLFGSPGNWPAAPQPQAHEMLLRDAPLPGKAGKKEFLYIFDFGDTWEFGIRLMEKSDTLDPHAIYPRVVASMGEGPDQYPDPEEFWSGEEDEEFDEDEEMLDNVVLPFPTPPKQH